MSYFIARNILNVATVPENLKFEADKTFSKTMTILLWEYKHEIQIPTG